ncbi:MAG TPA: GAF domain-containing protein [Burkholderiales bacterium]|nr:GAF domain-containing protein [Burkholderiales bacterium]
MTPTADAQRQLRTLLGAGDTRAALIFLNGLTEHRFTALYRFDKETLQNLYFFDRENPQQESTEDIPVMASYCAFVRDRNSLFSTPDSLQDERVRDHPKRQVVQSYCGVPLRDESGDMFGTICHFDFRPRPISDENVELMEAVAPLLKQSIPPAGRRRTEQR